MNPEDCFCDLAPLYALGVLEEPDRRWVEQQLAESPELAVELADWEAAVGAIAYSAPELAPAPDLKQRLFQRIGRSAPPPLAASIHPSAPSLARAVRSQDLSWRPYRQISGVQVARLHHDRASRTVTAVLRAAAGVCYPAHRHAAFEEIYMLSGDLIIGDQVYGPGDFIRSESGSLHAPRTQDGCMFLVRTSLDDEYLEGI
jgi:anti-sigma factor ChrR (cupin superfamily)